MHIERCSPVGMDLHGSCRGGACLCIPTHHLDRKLFHPLLQAQKYRRAEASKNRFLTIVYIGARCNLVNEALLSFCDHLLRLGY